MRRRILVADDEPGMLRAVRRVLARSYDVACAPGSEEALVLAEEFHPDLAILDIRMPELDGFELMERLKQMRPDLDVILMTGSATEPDRKLVRSIREEAFYFIQKPFDREVLQTLVERCMELRCLAEDNRRHVARLENVLAEARAFQASLIPRPQLRLGDVSVVARHDACETLCGDLYDYAMTDDGHLTFLVADVSGHGAAAAMLTGAVKSGFRSCYREGYAPASVVERIATGIRTFRANRFVSLFCGLVDPQQGTLEYVNAGHPPAIYWSRRDDAEELPPTGPIVSPVLDGSWTVERRSFVPGQRLLVFTDGLTEALDPEERFFGLDRVRNAVCGAPQGDDLPLARLLDAVREHVAGRTLADDLTVLGVGRLTRTIHEGSS